MSTTNRPRARLRLLASQREPSIHDFGPDLRGVPRLWKAVCVCSRRLSAQCTGRNPMTLELESYRSSNSPVLMHAPLDIPEICARLKQPHEAQRRRADDRRNVGISTVARKRRLSQDDARSRHTSAPLVRVSTPVWPSPHSESWDFRQPPVATEGRVHAG